ATNVPAEGPLFRYMMWQAPGDDPLYVGVAIPMVGCRDGANRRAALTLQGRICAQSNPLVIGAKAAQPTQPSSAKSAAYFRVVIRCPGRRPLNIGHRARPALFPCARPRSVRRKGNTMFNGES